MSMQDAVNQQVLNMLQQTGTAVLSTTNELAQVLLDYLRMKIEKDKSERALLNGQSGEIAIDKLQNAVKHGENLKNIFMPDEDISLLMKHLNSLGVLYAVSDIEKDNAKLVSFLERDEGKVLKCLDLIKAEHGLISEIAPNLFLDTYGVEDFKMTTNLSKIELELFRLYAKEEGIVFAAVGSEDRMNVLYTPEYSTKVNNALLRLGWDLKGPYANTIMEQVEHSLEARKALSYAIDEGEEDLYIVSSNNIRNYVHIHPEGYSYYKNANEILSESKDNKDYKNIVIDNIESLINPVVLTKEEFERSLSERQEIVDKKLTLNTLPKEYNYVEESSRVKRLQNLLNSKMGLNNEFEDSFALFDTSVTYAEFDTHEFEKDRDIREARELEMKRYNEACMYAQNRYKTVDISGENKSIDYLIARANKEREEAIKSGKTKEREENQR